MKALYTILFALGLAVPGMAAMAMDHMEQGAMETMRFDTSMQPGGMRMEPAADKMKKEKKKPAGKKSKNNSGNNAEMMKHDTMMKPDAMMKPDGMDHGSMQRMK